MKTLATAQNEPALTIAQRDAAILKRRKDEVQGSGAAGILIFVAAKILARHADAASPHTLTVATYLSCIAFVFMSFSIYRSIPLCKSKDLPVYRVVCMAFFIAINIWQMIELLTHQL
jgi:hypothetical protein